MSESWEWLYRLLISAGKLEKYIEQCRSEALTRARMASQIGQPAEIVEDSRADIRFCLCRADEAARALTAARERANSSGAGGFPEGVYTSA